MHSLRYYGCDKYVMKSARDAERNLCEALMPICGGRWGGTARFFRKVRAATVTLTATRSRSRIRIAITTVGAAVTVTINRNHNRNRHPRTTISATVAATVTPTARSDLALRHDRHRCRPSLRAVHPGGQAAGEGAADDARAQDADEKDPAGLFRLDDFRQFQNSEVFQMSPQTPPVLPSVLLF
jgi:hypothetical protein